MKPHNRKLFLYYDSPYAANATSLPPLHLPSTTNATSSPPSSSKKAPQYSPPLDSSMALTVVLLTALFFMGFFSIYIRRFSEDPITQLSRRRRYRGGLLNSFPFTSDIHHVSAPRKGLDPTTIGSLPVNSYHGNAKYQIDCPICLTEFEEKQWLKTIPHCKHVFHVECIDTWLSSHVSCPVCRGTRLLESMNGGSGELSVMQEGIDHQCVGQSFTVEISDACTVMETISGMRRVSSCSSLGLPPMLRRTLSF
ncbi:Ring/U-Box superfamily protein, putative isoform 1 [Hibiscus syriacus]|uniref:RING-type E3 ubiquitin transferase n=1 Tax=Hibiscus syriacus TaxID=106335 RepID=A0A6A3CJ88_HIBSY|nr:RING-H2 finger protein ATL57-like [Hibiscus syriacus]KAE8729420.1 Ring/U-Box superfamily protein, putative isoform 1 [Hibiscus syriacus]